MFNIVIAALFAILPACGTESADNTSCKWDATVQGNGEGASFIVLGNHVFYNELNY